MTSLFSSSDFDYNIEINNETTSLYSKNNNEMTSLFSSSDTIKNNNKTKNLSSSSNHDNAIENNDKIKEPICKYDYKNSSKDITQNDNKPNQQSSKCYGTVRYIPNVIFLLFNIPIFRKKISELSKMNKSKKINLLEDLFKKIEKSEDYSLNDFLEATFGEWDLYNYFNNGIQCFIQRIFELDESIQELFNSKNDSFPKILVITFKPMVNIKMKIEKSNYEYHLYCFIISLIKSGTTEYITFVRKNDGTWMKIKGNGKFEIVSQPKFGTNGGLLVYYQKDSIKEIILK